MLTNADYGQMALEKRNKKAAEAARAAPAAPPPPPAAPGTDAKRAAMQGAFSAAMAGPGPKELTMEASPGAGPLPQFEMARKQIGVMRGRAQQDIQMRGNATGQNQQDLMRRRLAAAGTLNSGAGIKALQNAQTEVDTRTGEELRSANEGFDAKALEQDANEAQQRVQLEEAAKGRNMAREQFNEESRFKEKMFRADTVAKFQAMDLQIDQLDLSKLQLKLQQEESDFNRRLATWEAQNSGGLFGGGGFLGLGIGNEDFKG